MADAGALGSGARLAGYERGVIAASRSRQQRACVHRRVCVQASLLQQVAEASVTFEPQASWQIYAGAAAGVAPFVIAGVEFGKRIAQQKRCQVCGGSGLVKRKDYYFRCNGCGGFLPWQSWSRFFSGR